MFTRSLESLPCVTRYRRNERNGTRNAKKGLFHSRFRRRRANREIAAIYRKQKSPTSGEGVGRGEYVRSRHFAMEIRRLLLRAPSAFPVNSRPKVFPSAAERTPCDCRHGTARRGAAGGKGRRGGGGQGLEEGGHKNTAYAKHRAARTAHGCRQPRASVKCRLLFAPLPSRSERRSRVPTRGRAADKR